LKAPIEAFGIADREQQKRLLIRRAWASRFAVVELTGYGACHPEQKGLRGVARVAELQKLVEWQSHCGANIVSDVEQPVVWGASAHLHCSRHLPFR
jgi:hypothetical protein